MSGWVDEHILRTYQGAVDREGLGERGAERLCRLRDRRHRSDEAKECKGNGRVLHGLLGGVDAERV